MAITTKSSGAPGVSLSYVTIGAVLAVLSGTSFFFTTSSWPQALNYVRWCAFILGLVFLVIGFGVGRIGQVSGETETVATTDPQAVVVPPSGSANGSGGTNPIYARTTNSGS
jgi:hypothetical protein